MRLHTVLQFGNFSSTQGAEKGGSRAWVTFDHSKAGAKRNACRWWRTLLRKVDLCDFEDSQGSTEKPCLGGGGRKGNVKF